MWRPVVAATIERYELRDQDNPERFHAWITQAYLDEVSITPTPANRDCVITSRLPTSPQPEMFDLAHQGVGKMIEIVDLLRGLNRARPEAPQRPPAPRVNRPRAPAVRRPTEFARLVDGVEPP